jgi:hypothetical protein
MIKTYLIFIFLFISIKVFSVTPGVIDNLEVHQKIKSFGINERLLNFENGSPTLYERYESTNQRSDEYLMGKMEFKNGVPHGRWFTNVFYNINEVSSEPERNEPIIYQEGYYNDGLVDGTWKEFLIDERYPKKSVLETIRKFNKGDGLTSVEYIIRSFDDGPVEIKEITYYRNQKLSYTEFEGDGKFRKIQIVQFLTPTKLYFDKYKILRSEDFPNYDGYGERDFLDKYIDEGKSRIDEFIVKNNLPG